jgi:hypothetical protein
MLKGRCVVLSMFLAASSLASAQTLIDCQRGSNSKGAALSTPIYLSRSGQLCFDVRGLPLFSGKNCAVNGQSIRWSAVKLIFVKDESHGRDKTNFRVLSPVITPDRLHYTIEWTRGSKWNVEQIIEINRLTGYGVEYFVGEHGGTSMSCTTMQKKI